MKLVFNTYFLNAEEQKRNFKILIQVTTFADRRVYLHYSTINPLYAVKNSL